VPYFEFLEDDVDEAVLAQIPDDREVTVLCAKGAPASSSRARSRPAATTSTTSKTA